MKMMGTYSKPHLSYQDQVRLLNSRGLKIDDQSAAEQILCSIGYYRLSGYWYPYRSLLPSGSRADTFEPGTTLEQITALYDFDRKLKLLLMAAIERIEVAVRVRVGHVLGKRGPYSHLDPASLDGRFVHPSASRRRSQFDEWKSRFQEAQSRSTEDFVKHFRTRYDGRLPTWVATEVMDFGLVSHLFGGMKRQDRDKIARQLRIVDASGRGAGAALENWLRCVNYIRNVCAHHSRLWNRNMTVQVAPRQLRQIRGLGHVASLSVDQFARVYPALCLIAFLADSATVDLEWKREVIDLLATQLPKTGRRVAEMGAPSTWKQANLWTRR